MAKNQTSFKPGHVANPNGRPRIVLPEIQRAIDENKNALKGLIIKYLSFTKDQLVEKTSNKESSVIEIALGSVFINTIKDGDMVKLKMILEIVFGKLPEERKEFDLTHEEKKIILSYRTALETKDNSAIINDAKEAIKKLESK